MRNARVPATALLAGLLAVAFSLTACSSSGTSISAAELAKLQLDSDTKQIQNIEVVFHLAASTKNIPLMMSLYADDATVTFGGKTYIGKDQVQQFFEKAGPFQLGNHWVSDTPAYKMKVTVDKDRGTLYFECHYVNADNRTVAVVVGADQKVARINGKWLITQLVAATPVLAP